MGMGEFAVSCNCCDAATDVTVTVQACSTSSRGVSVTITNVPYGGTYNVTQTGDSPLVFPAVPNAPNIDITATLSGATTSATNQVVSSSFLLTYPSPPSTHVCRCCNSSGRFQPRTLNVTCGLGSGTLTWQPSLNIWLGDVFGSVSGYDGATPQNATTVECSVTFEYGCAAVNVGWFITGADPLGPCTFGPSRCTHVGFGHSSCRGGSGGLITGPLSCAGPVNFTVAYTEGENPGGCTVPVGTITITE